MATQSRVLPPARHNAIFVSEKIREYDQLTSKTPLSLFILEEGETQERIGAAYCPEPNLLLRFAGKAGKYTVIEKDMFPFMNLESRLSGIAAHAVRHRLQDEKSMLITEEFLMQNGGGIPGLARYVMRVIDKVNEMKIIDAYRKLEIDSCLVQEFLATYVRHSSDSEVIKKILGVTEETIHEVISLLDPPD